MRRREELVIGILTVSLLIHGSSSLKEKRMVLRSVKKRLRSRFNVCVAELDDHDKWQKALLGVASIGSQKRFVNSVLDKVIELLRAHRGVVVDDYDLELL